MGVELVLIFQNGGRNNLEMFVIIGPNFILVLLRILKKQSKV